VYVQSHALERLRERLSPVRAHHAHMWLCLSFAQPSVFSSSSGGPMLAYRIAGQTLGYLPLSIEKGKVVVKTFLFLSCSATVQGRRLGELLGIGRTDSEYLALHTLSAFAETDILDSAWFRGKLTEAGCGALLRDFSVFFDGRAKPRAGGYARDLEKYLIVAARE
jgi:hypothetical protein